MPTKTVTPGTRAKLARSVLVNNLHLRGGERIIIEAWTHTLPWAVAFAREARRLGAQPLVPYEDEKAYWDAVDDNEDAVLGGAPPHEWAALSKSDVYVHFWGPGDRVRLNALPEARANRLFGFNPNWYAAAAKAGVRGARMEIGRIYPTTVRAYGVDEAEWTDQVVRGAMVTPEKLAAAAAPVAKVLRRGEKLRIHDDHGTDLTLGLAHRPARSQIGRPASYPFGMLTTLPSGMVRVALDESVADGTIVANRSSYYDDGKEDGGVLRFRRGKLTSASFDHGGKRFKAGFNKGGKGRDRPGIFSIGLNPYLHNTPQVEDTELGAVTVAVGGNRGLGGKNPSPFFGWVVNSGATVEIDGRPLQLRR
jgi:leucyl aminopeptidase (aminopeptidase T)